jgi:Phage integrase, N-terminal SAM-like domain
VVEEATVLAQVGLVLAVGSAAGDACPVVVLVRSYSRCEGKSSDEIAMLSANSGSSSARISFARRSWAYALGQAQAGVLPVDRQLTTGAYLADWLEHYAKPKVRRGTYDSYSAMVRLYLSPEIGRIPLAQLQPEHVSRMLDRLKDCDKSKRGKAGGPDEAAKPAKLSPTTVRYAYKVLRIALGRAVKLGRVHRNICTLIDPPRAPKGDLQPMSADEARKFLASVKDDPLGPLYRLALTKGFVKASSWRCAGMTWTSRLACSW